MKIEKVYKQLGKMIAHRRNELGMSHGALAVKVKMSRPSVINMEAGRQRIQIHRMMELENALGYPTGYLLLKLFRGEG